MARHMLVLAGAVLLLADLGPAHARSVFLNEVRIDGVRSQSFENVNVEIDARGDVHIRSDQYRILEGATNIGAAKGPAKTPTPGVTGKAALPRRRYWLVSQENGEGATQYAVDVFINEKHIKTVRRGDAVHEITSDLHKGKNEVIFRWTKKITGNQPRSTDKQLYLRVTIAAGDSSSGTLILRDVLLESRRTAGDMESTATRHELEIH